jgi:hypothetical protein
MVSVTLDASSASEPLTGRLFMFVTDRSSGKEPRLLADSTAASDEDPDEPYAPLFGMDVAGMAPGASTTMTGDAARGYPFRTLEQLPAGDYTVQAVLHRYTLFSRTDGRELWAHLDRREGQKPVSPGDVVADPTPLHVEDGKPFALTTRLTKIIPNIGPTPDTQFVKRLWLKSELLSKFWGHDMEVGAVIVLPRSYYDHTDKQFPVLYYQGHFDESENFVLPDQRPDIPADASPRKRAWRLRRQREWDLWHAKDGPQLIVVTLLHPTPYYDSSYLVDSPAAGPYGAMVMQELIPAIEREIRIIKKPWARVLAGGSIGGWTSAAMQIYHPEFFGGVWSGCPDPVDFHHFYGVDLYDDDNAFVVPGQHWVRTERLFSRALDGTPHNTMRRLSQLHLALASHARSGELLDNFSASFGPIGDDGYPRPIWNHETGRIDHEAARAWRDLGFDLRAYLEQHWATIGQQLAGKLRFFCGDADQYELTQGMLDLQAFLEKATPPYGGYFYYAPHRGHEMPYSREALFEDMLRAIAANAPRDLDLRYINPPPASLAPLGGSPEP